MSNEILREGAQWVGKHYYNREVIVTITSVREILIEYIPEHFIDLEYSSISCLLSGFLTAFKPFVALGQKWLTKGGDIGTITHLTVEGKETFVCIRLECGRYMLAIPESRLANRIE